MQPFPFWTSESFRYNLIKGQIASELVKGLLAKAGYQVTPFGYESSISQFRHDVEQRQGKVPLSDSNNRMRSMPDLIAYDKDNTEISFVEVKFSNIDTQNRIRFRAKALGWYKQYWHDCILVAVVPKGNIFYAQKVSLIDVDNTRSSNSYHLSKDFDMIEKHFPKVTIENIEQHKLIFEQFIPVLAARDDCNDRKFTEL